MFLFVRVYLSGPSVAGCAAREIPSGAALDLQPLRQPAVYGPQAQRVCTRAFRAFLRYCLETAGRIGFLPSSA